MKLFTTLRLLLILSTTEFISAEAFAQVVPMQVDSTKKDSSKVEFIMPKIYIEEVPRRKADHSWLLIQMTSHLYGEDFPPYDLLLINPQGEKLGCDGTQNYSEIIDGKYEKIYDQDVDGNDYPVINLYLNNPKSGNYTLKIFCKTFDSYELSMEGEDCYYTYANIFFEAIVSQKNEVHEYGFIWLDKIKIDPNGNEKIEFTKIPEIAKDKMR